MKAPREILLERHQAAGPKLDAIRHEVVSVAADVNRRKQPIRELTFAATLAKAITLLFQELVWPCRRIWTGLAAAWVVILAVNFSMQDHSSAVAMKSPPTSEMIMAWRQQERLLAELIGQSETHAAEPPKPFVPQPRSEGCVEILKA